MSKKHKTPDTPTPPTPPTPPAPPEPHSSNERSVHIERHVVRGPAEGRPEPPQPPAKPDHQTMIAELGVPLDRTFVRKQSAIFLKQVADHYVLYDPLAHTFLRLNSSAHQIWQSIGDAERRFIPDIKSDLHRDGPSIDDTDIDATLAAFIDNGVLTVVTTTQE